MGTPFHPDRCRSRPLLNAARFEGEPKVTLFERASGFLVRPSRIDAKPARFVRRPRGVGEGFDDKDVPF